MLCYCNNIITLSSDRAQLLIDLEKKLLVLHKKNQEHINQLNGCCVTCIDSMLHDVNAELLAMSIRTQEVYSLVRQFQEISYGTEDYKVVYNRFNSSGYNIIRIEKNYNPILFNEYQMHVDKSREKLLFHGSANINYINILTSGFDINKSKAGSLGYGVYFAEDPNYSHSYTSSITLLLDSNSKKIRNMLLCRVSLHKASSMLVGSHNIWCVHHDRHCYPEYIVYYDLTTMTTVDP
jgi:hypothetical protein